MHPAEQGSVVGGEYGGAADLVAHAAAGRPQDSLVLARTRTERRSPACVRPHDACPWHVLGCRFGAMVRGDSQTGHDATATSLMTPLFVSEGLVTEHRSVALCEPQADCLPLVSLSGRGLRPRTSPNRSPGPFDRLMAIERLAPITAQEVTRSLPPFVPRWAEEPRPAHHRTPGSERGFRPCGRHVAPPWPRVSWPFARHVVSSRECPACKHATAKRQGHDGMDCRPSLGPLPSPRPAGPPDARPVWLPPWPALP